MIFLAELNNENICIGLKMVKHKIDDGKHVEIDSMNGDYLHRKYKGGVWLEEKILPEQDPQPSLEDKINFIYYKQLGVI